jgi:endo-1,4-beta-D-glucanase Y
MRVIGVSWRVGKVKVDESNGFRPSWVDVEGNIRDYHKGDQVFYSEDGLRVSKSLAGNDNGNGDDSKPVESLDEVVKSGSDILEKCKTEIDRIFSSAPEESKAKLVASLFIYSQQRLQE